MFFFNLESINYILFNKHKNSCFKGRQIFLVFSGDIFKKNIFFGVPHLPTFISFFIHVIASIAYFHPVYGGIRTHNLSDVSLLP